MHVARRRSSCPERLALEPPDRSLRRTLAFISDDLSEERTICIQSEVGQSNRCFGCEPSDVSMLVTECDRLASVPLRDSLHMIGRRISGRAIGVANAGKKRELGRDYADRLL
jgi:hypothetical protein